MSMPKSPPSQHRTRLFRVASRESAILRHPLSRGIGALTLVASASLLTTAAFAQAKEAAEDAVVACPPGAFCEETEVAPPVVSDEGSAVEVPEVVETEVEPLDETEDSETEDKEPVTVVLPPPSLGSDPDEPRVFEYRPGKGGKPDQVVIYKEGAGKPAAIEPPKMPSKSKRKRLRRHRRWGLNLRVNGMLLPQYRDGESTDAGMAGLGFSLKYRPTPHFAFDFGTDFIGGVDSNGFERQEIPMALSGQIYVNPRDLAQFYFTGGINWSWARVYSEDPQINLAEDGGTRDAYTYFGGHAGLGLEFRVAPLVGINVDGLAIIRARTDDDLDGRFPEYYNREEGVASNSSAAGMLRAGVTFWW